VDRRRVGILQAANFRHGVLEPLALFFKVFSALARLLVLLDEALEIARI